MLLPWIGGCAEEGSTPDTCDRLNLPFEAYVSVGAQTVIPAGPISLIAAAHVRYMDSWGGNGGFPAPRGPAVSLGLGVAFR